MEAGVTRLRVLVIVACLVAAACEEDPARSVKIAAHPPLTAGAVAGPPGTTAPPRLTDWRPEACPPPPEDSPGPSTLTATGPCVFTHGGAVSCEASVDDFIMAGTRQAARGATLVIFINVEKYAGPGHYDGAQMFVEVEDKTSIYRWSSDNVSITVGPGEEFAELPATRLDAEPLLINCSGQVGPNSNWLYDCRGRSGATAIEGTTEVVSGTLRCGKKQ
jgi:hypothetical protein